MTLAERFDLPEDRERLLARALQGVLVGIIVVGVVTMDVSIIVTGAIGLAVTLLPALIRREYGYSMDPWLVLWITLAMILHTAGSMGLYEELEWFDSITHTVSGALIAGIGYASFRALELHSDAIEVPDEFRAVFIVVFVLAAGMFWELIEIAAGDLITIYGVDDTVSDLMYDTLGAVLVALWGTGYFGGLVGFFRQRIRSS